MINQVKFRTEKKDELKGSMNSNINAVRRFFYFAIIKAYIKRTQLLNFCTCVLV